MANPKNKNEKVSKEHERAELHRAIWQMANDLRGSVDGWDFKQYEYRCASRHFALQDAYKATDDAIYDIGDDHLNEARNKVQGVLAVLWALGEYSLDEINALIQEAAASSAPAVANA